MLTIYSVVGEHPALTVVMVVAGRRGWAAQAPRQRHRGLSLIKFDSGCNIHLHGAASEWDAKLCALYVRMFCSTATLR